MGLLDFLYPKRCVRCKAFGDYACPDCFSSISFDPPMICLACGSPSIDSLTHPKCRGRYVIDGCFAVVAYKGIIKKLLYQYKYRPNLFDLRTFLADLFYEGMIQQELLYRQLEHAVLTPIPLHASRLRSRGYDQVELLTESLAKKSGVQVASLLKRVRKTDSQYGLKREARMHNIKEAFEVSAHEAIRENTVLIVDDIVTSGATLAEAARVLKRGGCKKVYGLAFAHGQ